MELQTLSPEEINAILPRLADELKASYLCTAMAAWCRTNGYTYSKKFLKEQAEEHEAHAKRWIRLLSDWKCKFTFPSIESAESNFSGLKDLLEKLYQTDINLLNSYQSTAKEMEDKGFMIVAEKMEKYVHIENHISIKMVSILTKMGLYTIVDPTYVNFDHQIIKRYDCIS